jgi:hypothetical protein
MPSQYASDLCERSISIGLSRAKSVHEREDVMTMQRTILKSLSAASIVATCFAFSALAQGLPKANQPEEVGFSSERLNRVAKAFQADVD